ncbi:TPA: hypothetical protein QDB09_000588 [Burkholderia vietnamiensis]|nr:hypothetical protein [Burkholderia vietnamiensis]
MLGENGCVNLSMAMPPVVDVECQQQFRCPRHDAQPRVRVVRVGNEAQPGTRCEWKNGDLARDPATRPQRSIGVGEGMFFSEFEMAHAPTTSQSMGATARHSNSPADSTGSYRRERAKCSCFDPGRGRRADAPMPSRRRTRRDGIGGRRGRHDGPGKPGRRLT